MKFHIPVITEEQLITPETYKRRLKDNLYLSTCTPIQGTTCISFQNRTCFSQSLKADVCLFNCVAHLIVSPTLVREREDGEIYLKSGDYRLAETPVKLSNPRYISGIIGVLCEAEFK